MTPAAHSSDRRCLILIPIAALVAVAPLIAHGCSCGHDFDFHLLSWMEAARQLSHGNLHPHWAFSAAYNAGEPRFVFYPPLSWYLGALLGLLLTHLPCVTQAAGWTAVPILFTWIALTAAGFTMFRLARTLAGTNAALLATTLYVANPYMLFTAYERSAYAELLAAAWIPLLLHAILRDRVTIKGIALPVALLWLTNVPAAILGSYTFALLAVIRLATNLDAPESGTPHLASEMWVARHNSRPQLTLRALAGFALGLALAAFYILPAAYESRFIQIAMATIGGMRVASNFLFEHTGTSPDDLLHDQVLHTASLIAVILLAASAAALALILVQRKPSGAPRLASETWELRHMAPFPTLPLAILNGGIAFLLTPLSTPIWKHAPEAALLQFPWRLLLIDAPVSVLTVARALIQHPFALLRQEGRRELATLAASVVILAAILTLPAYHLFRQPCDPEDTASARLALFQSNAGTDPTDEYTPIAADNEALNPNNPPYWLAPDSNDGPLTVTPIYQLTEGPAARSAIGSAPEHLALKPQSPAFLILNLRNYPAWSITVNGAPTSQSTQRSDGLIAIPIPAGPSTIDIHYAHTFDQALGDGISLLALSLCAFITRAKPQIAGTH